MAIPTDLGQVNVGNIRKFAAAFTDALNNNAATDPATVAFGFESPAGAITRYVYGTDAQVIKDSTGNYHVNQLLDVEGLWYVRVYSTGAGTAAVDGYISAVGSPIGNGP